jgi:predicted Zn-dependent protease with MMP-like domain
MIAAAEREVVAVRKSLPADLAERAENVIIVFETRPSRRLVREGIEPDTLGLFEGGSLLEPEGEGDLLPPRVLLFLENILDEAEGEEEAYRREVRVTYVHELGHYLGFDEDDLVERGIE